jgi:hypothetical protein
LAPGDLQPIGIFHQGILENLEELFFSLIHRDASGNRTTAATMITTSESLKSAIAAINKLPTTGGATNEPVKQLFGVEFSVML